jgi:hypothetical protein
LAYDGGGSEWSGYYRTHGSAHESLRSTTTTWLPMVDEQHFTNNGDTGENLMNQAQAIYAQAAQEFDIAKKYKTNCEFWKVVLGTLLEEEENRGLTTFEFYLAAVDDPTATPQE